MNNKMKVKPIFASKKKKLPKFNDGDPLTLLPQEKYDPVNIDINAGIRKLKTGTATNIGGAGKVASAGISNETLGGIGNIASGVGSMLATDDAGSVGSYAGGILGSAGQGASMGAALGPWGAGVGALAGGAYGLFNAKRADAAQESAQARTQINTNLSQNQNMSGDVNAKYNLRNFANDRVPGLNKGIAKFSDGNPGMTGMMKSKMAYAAQFGNPSAKRMISPNPDTYTFTGNEGTNEPVGELGTHYMGSYDNIARPSIQKLNGKMTYTGFPSKSNVEDIQFDRPEDASYFAEHYKEIAPMMKSGKFNKGVAKFKSGITNTNQPNAMIAPEEGIMDGVTGRVSIVPGQYNSSNPDVVSANLTEGSSVFSNKKSQTLPGGKSTPADIIARTEKMQKINDKILSPKEGERKLSRLDQLTAKLNKSNIQKQAENLNKFNSLINPQQQQVDNLPKYEDGVDKFTNQRMQGLQTIVDPITGETINLQVPIKRGQTFAKNAVDIFNKGAANKWGGTYNFGVKDGSLDEVMSGWGTGYINQQDKRYKTGGSKGHQPGIFTVPLTKELADKYRVGNTPGASLSITNNTPSVAVTPAVTSQNVPDQIDQTYNTNIKKTQDALGSNPPNGIDLSSIGNKLMSLAPIAYNSRNASPEVASPIYQDYMNPNKRYNIASELAESTKQRQMSRYTNASINTSTGSNMAYSADAYSRGNDQLSNLMGKAQTANAGYRDEYANRFNQNTAVNTAEDKRIYDLNSRNRAAARTFGSKNAEMLSQYAQVNQLMGNQKKADILNSNIWQAYASAVSPEQKAYLQSLMSKYTK